MSGKKIRFLPPRGASERERDFAINELIKAANEPVPDPEPPAPVTAADVSIDAIAGISAEDVQGALEELADRDVDLDPWGLQPIGSPIPIFTNLFASMAAALPPTNKAYRYVLLTAGESYNSGVLTSESVSGSAPLVNATAVISLSGSPLNGKTICLINTERRVLRAGSSGTVENDQMQTITGSARLRRSANDLVLGASGAFSYNTTGASTAYMATTSSTQTHNLNFDSSDSPGARAGTETRAKNVGVTYVMRIL